MIEVYAAGKWLSVEATHYTDVGHGTGEFNIVWDIEKVIDEDGNEVPDKPHRGNTIYSLIEDYLNSNDCWDV